ncbi:hypothetical protein ACP70R_046275 [Stipagrostis hirtigluma subsp. patula]
MELLESSTKRSCRRLEPRPRSMETEAGAAAAAAEHRLLRWLSAPRQRRRRGVCSPGFRRRGRGIRSRFSVAAGAFRSAEVKAAAPRSPTLF